MNMNELFSVIAFSKQHKDLFPVTYRNYLPKVSVLPKGKKKGKKKPPSESGSKRRGKK